MLNISQRHRVAEIMDDPGLGADQHIRALRGLERINRLSNSVATLWPSIAQLVQKRHHEPVRVLDIASGAGDVPIGLCLRAKAVGLPLEVTACDRSARAMEYIRTQAASRKIDLCARRLDILTDELPQGFDVIICSLFLHHLNCADAKQTLKLMSQASRHLVLVNDLHRSVPGLCLAYVGTRAITRSDVVHVDGPRSVRAAFTCAEVRLLANECGLRDVTVERRWPYRWLLTWWKP